MRCPMCESSVLTATHRHGVEVDVCPQCKGIWLDRGELEKILDALDAQLDAAAASPLPPPPAAPAAGRDDDRRYDDRRYDDRGRDERPWMAPEVLLGRAWSTKSPPPGWKKGKKPKKHKSALAHLLDEVL